MKKSLIQKEERIIKREWKNFVFDAVFAICAIIITSVFYNNLYLTTILLSAITLVALWKWKSWTTIAIFIIVALLAPLLEMVAIYFGAWQYSISNIVNVPIWLFILWGDAGALIYQLTIEINRMGVKK